MENQLKIIDFVPDLAEHFKRLNIAWIQKFFWVEEVDELILSNPKEQIIDKGGQVYFALVNQKVAGTVALISIEEGVYELSKMAVDENFRGNKIGNELLKHCLLEAKRLNAKKVILFSNTILENAIHLYKKYGFVEVPLGTAEYKRSDIKMELEIK